MSRLAAVGRSLVAFCCVVFVGSAFAGTEGAVASAVSPDGRNTIRIWSDPLGYEVVREGRTVVARTEIGLTVDGKPLEVVRPGVTTRKLTGSVKTPVYKKQAVDLSGNETLVRFKDWAIRLVARNDGVAYRFETSLPGQIVVNGEKAGVTVPSPDIRCWYNRTPRLGAEETIPEAGRAGDIDWNGGTAVYLPFVYTVEGTTVAVTESDVHDYPMWYLPARFERAPKTVSRVGGWGETRDLPSGGRWVSITSSQDYLVQTQGKRTFPWRTFVLASAPSKLCEADIVYALATPSNGDFSWVKPGKVAWDWWNCFDNKGEAQGCTTAGYKRFIDFAASNRVEYVILDEGWSESLNVWKFHPRVDVPEVIRYGREKGVGIVRWMAWAQAYGQEEKVAAHFAKLGAKGFKVDFMDRSDAEVGNFLERFAAACARHRMLVDYHGVCRPVGLSRTYPNVLNYEGVHGLEQMKWYNGKYDFTLSDVRVGYLRMTAGQMDYTPGAMDNYPIGKYKGGGLNPGSTGTRCHQMALMALYEAPLQMLCDSPTKYERNAECLAFMSATPVVWDDTVGLGGDPDGLLAIARRKGDVWYAAAIVDATAKEFTLDTKFLGGGAWKMEVFRDADDAATEPTHYVHERDRAVKAGDSVPLRMAPGGGFVARFTKAK